MIAFPSMLIYPAKNAGMKVPEDADNYDPNEFPHFHVFCTVQIGAPHPYAGCHFDNAKIIAALSDKEIKEITYEELMDNGFQIGYSK